MRLCPKWDDTRHRHSAGMADTLPLGGQSQRRRSPRRFVRKLYLWRRSRFAVDHHIRGYNSFHDANTDHREDTFIGCNPSRQTLDSINPRRRTRPTPIVRSNVEPGSRVSTLINSAFRRHPQDPCHVPGRSPHPCLPKLTHQMDHRDGNRGNE